MAQTFSAKEVAQECGTDARTLRKFLREFLPAEEQPGQGGRYSFTKGEVTKIKKGFGDWGKKAAAKAATADAPAAKKGKKSKKDEAPPVEELDAAELIDLEDLDPDVEDIEAGEDEDPDED